uniref:Phorbol-ester/DAG-type domain-containing protein n=1 Tax=Lactuca sativa TaxID=4236 RepID=A0A9R1XFQ9_LACSA|nr:hypothetical protein LSAT_V11C500279470 [Lactuca sativa]
MVLCGGDFDGMADLWIYKCDKCLYYVHVDCVRVPPPAGPAKTIKNYEDVDYPGLLHLPFRDETYSLPKHLFFQQIDDKCHNPLKKTQLQCNGCHKTIMSTMPFYKFPHLICNFALHEWCTRLPLKIKNYLGHPKHTLYLIYSNILGCFFDVFYCHVCHLACNGFAYGCVTCNYYVDITCGFIPKQIIHKSHQNHLLSLIQVERDKYDTRCHMCQTFIRGGELSFHCNMCDIYIQCKCALLLAETIMHKFDKHPMNLSYLPIENHKSEYFCEICEHDLNPHKSFYHCKYCAQSVHTDCAQLIVECECEIVTHSSSERSDIYFFGNIKFGGILNTHSHPHQLSFAQGIVSDGQCSKCGWGLQYTTILKCLECRFKQLVLNLCVEYCDST